MFWFCLLLGFVRGQHLAFCTQEALTNIFETTRTNLDAFSNCVKGDKLPNVVA
jgi:lactate dehydrogenase-like 2-hydroxyacid dehydrogenase